MIELRQSLMAAFFIQRTHKSQGADMVLIKERVGKLLEYISELIYPESKPVDNYKMLRSDERFSNIAGIDTSDWDDYKRGQIWGGHREYYWFETKITIPESFDGKCVVYSMKTGREGEWDATNPQFMIYINGKPAQGLDVNHREAIISEHAKKGDVYTIVLSAFTGDRNFSLYLDSEINVLDRKTEHYYYDMHVPYEIARMLDKDDDAYIKIIRVLNDSLNLVDMRQERSERFYKSIDEAQANITEEFYKKYCGKEDLPTVYCVGHTHIDCAWMWTLAVTKDKAARSFSTVLELMKEYPEYIFMSSQPQLYSYVKEDHPEIYSGIEDRIKEGRWEPEGGMWLEADCNLSSGESLVRQFLHGQRFFMKEFGKRSEILWLPDVFGYSAALPQIMKKSDVKYFMTTKISWNEFNKMPDDTFMWEGIDGTEVLTHFIPTRDYHKAAVENGAETEHFTTYNGYINPSQIKGAWDRYSNKELNREVLCSFGFGDGGGGPTRDMLEIQRRLAAGIPGCPKTKMSTSEEFFHTLEKHVDGSRELHKWAGELYLEYHRGTYTSMARNKKYNRRSEFLYEDCELYSLLANELTGAIYPKQDLYDSWQVILRNQFHDILPGSSIKEVYDDSRVEYEGILAKGREIESAGLNRLASQIAAPEGSLVVFNPNNRPLTDAVIAVVPEGMAVYGSDGMPLDQQRLKEGGLLVVTDGVPGKGYKSYKVGKTNVEMAESDMVISTTLMENMFYRIALNEKGQFSSIYDKRNDRELLTKGECGNVIMSYEDRPHNFDAWDLNNYYTEKSWEVDDVESIEVIEDGPVRGGIRIVRKYLDSVIAQNIYMYAGLDRIDIKNEIDWKEHQIFLRALYPVDIHTSEATFEIQYGNVKRPTHANTSWDFAKFEVCAHKWLDVSEDDYGVSILNDCKYGCSVKNGVIGLSMLKSAIDPNPEADKEHHEFTYSIVPHEGDWRKAGTVERAYVLNNPATAVIKQNEGGTLKPEYSLVSCDSENVVIEVVKQAEDSDDVIIRLYENYNRRTDCTLSFGKEIAFAAECNMLEETAATCDDDLTFDDRHISFRIMPYEIKTIKVKLK